MPRKIPFAVYIREVEDRILAAASAISSQTAEARRAYYSTANYVLGLTVPVQRKLLQEGYSFSKETTDKQLLIWDAIWRYSQYHESKAQALLWLSNIKDTQTLIQFWPTINSWVKQIDSWDMSDNLSSVFVRILENAKDLTYPILQKWNNSKNPWERRQSIVSLLYYSSARKKVLAHNQILSLVENLIEDDHKFVQKGVGWTLRECYSVHPKATEKFVRKHATKFSAIAFSSASEKWPNDFGIEIKRIRSDKRKK